MTQYCKLERSNGMTSQRIRAGDRWIDRWLDGWMAKIHGEDQTSAFPLHVSSMALTKQAQHRKEERLGNVEATSIEVRS